jgi:hypothetical protein
MFPRIDKGPIEYTLDVFPAYSTEKQRPCTRFLFRTIEEFNHFQYRISIEEKQEKGTLRFVLKGLKVKGLLPGVGTAASEVDLFDLEGSYDVTVLKPGDISNSFRFSKGTTGLRLLENVAGEQPFLTVQISNDSTGQE